MDIYIIGTLAEVESIKTDNISKAKRVNNNGIIFAVTYCCRDISLDGL